MTKLEENFEKIKAFGDTKWITKDRRTILIKDMKPSHLKNSYILLGKQVEALANVMDDVPSFQGEMAQDMAMNQWHSEVDRYFSLQKKYEMMQLYYLLITL